MRPGGDPVRRLGRRARQPAEPDRGRRSCARRRWSCRHRDLTVEQAAASDGVDRRERRGARSLVIETRAARPRCCAAARRRTSACTASRPGRPRSRTSTSTASDRERSSDERIHGLGPDASLPAYTPGQDVAVLHVRVPAGFLVSSDRSSRASGRRSDRPYIDFIAAGVLAWGVGQRRGVRRRPSR